MLSIPGVGGFQPKGKTNSCQAFMKRMMMYGEVEHRIPKRPLAFFFFFFFITFVTESPLPGGCDLRSLERKDREREWLSL